MLSGGLCRRPVEVNAQREELQRTRVDHDEARRTATKQRRAAEAAKHSTQIFFEQVIETQREVARLHTEKRKYGEDFAAAWHAAISKRPYLFAS